MISWMPMSPTRTSHMSNLCFDAELNMRWARRSADNVEPEQRS